MPTELVSYPSLNFGARMGAQLVDWQEHFRLDDTPISKGLGTHVPAEVADLLDIAVAVYVTDRLRRRRPPSAVDDGTHWSRQLSVQIAVRKPEIWTSAAVSSRLHQLLIWLTDDDWDIRFAGDPRFPRNSETQGTLFSDPPDEPIAVGLMSGGLDSALGALRDASEREGELLLVAARSHSRLDRCQRRVTSELGAVGARRTRLFSIPIGLTAAGRALVDGREESTQRTRGFVFLALGIAAAATAGVNELRVYENGPGALNLALSPAQRGSMSTRAMRPETLLGMQELAELALGKSFSIVNPDFWMTKRELCAAAPPQAADLIAASVSCDNGHTRRDHEHPLCGSCTSCLLRRQSLIASGWADIDQLELARMPGDALGAIGRYASSGVKLMLGQVVGFEAALSESDPWAALVRRQPDLARARRALKCDPTPLVDLLARYCADWRAVDRSAVQQLLGADGARSHA